MELREYQAKAVKQMLLGAVLNTSPVGIGKTYMAMGCIEDITPDMTLILAPKRLISQWEGEISKALTGFKPFLIYGKPKDRVLLRERFNAYKGKKIYITSYETARIDILYLSLLRFNVVIYDEVHKLKEPTTRLKKALKNIRGEKFFGLSGSPVVNHYGNTYNILNSLIPQFFPNYWQFINTYAVKAQFGGVLFFRNEEKIREMFAPFITHVSWQEAKFELPPKIETDVPVLLSDKERSIYNKMQQELIFEFEQGDITKLSSPIMLQNTLAKVGKLQEAVDHLSLVGDHKESSKMEALKDLLDTIDPDDKVIIFTRFSRMAEIIAKELDCHIITGKTTNSEAVLKDFKTSGKVLVGTNSIREGLNIQEANVVIHYDLDFTSSGMEQRNGRAHRSGQKKPVLVYHLLAVKSIDYKIKRLLEKKKSLKENLDETIKLLLNKQI